MNRLPEQIAEASRAVAALVEALKPRTETEYWAWLAHNDPLRYIATRRAERYRGRR